MLGEEGKAVTTVGPGSAFDTDLGFSSFQVVELITRVEARLGIELTRFTSVTDLGTLGDLFQACRAAVAGRISRMPADDLRAVRERAQARRPSSP